MKTIWKNQMILPSRKELGKRKGKVMMRLHTIIMSLFMGLTSAIAQQNPTSEPLEASESIKSCVPSEDKSKPEKRGGLKEGEFVRPDKIMIFHFKASRGYVNKDRVSIEGKYINSKGEKIRFGERIGHKWGRANAEIYVEQFLDVRREALARGRYLQRVDEYTFEISDIDFLK